MINHPKTRIKICGITCVDNAAEIAATGVDAIGLVFYEPSPRHLSDLGLAREIAQAVGAFVSVVGLVVDPNVDYLESILGAVPLNVIQFHGQEKPDFCEGFGRPYMKAIRMKQSVNLETQAQMFDAASALLLDTYRPGKPGGTGEVFDWQMIPRELSHKVVLAGGLNAKNVGQAIQTVKPYGVDVSGGVEYAKGKKSIDAVEQFVRSVNSA